MLSALVPASGQGVPVISPWCRSRAELPSGLGVLVTSQDVRGVNRPSSRMCGTEVSRTAFTPSHKHPLFSFPVRSYRIS